MSNRPTNDLSWVEILIEVDVSDPACGATLDNDGWRLLLLATGKGGQPVAVFGWPDPLSGGSNE